MVIKKISLRADDPDITLTAYVNDIKNAVPAKARDTMFIIPGGGYFNVCADREGEMIALAYLAKGYNAFVLNYSVKDKARFPRSLCDASLGMSYIRKHAEEYGVNPDRIFAVGFSAGGHLAGSLGLMWDLPEIYRTTGIAFGSNRPNGIILGYPVVSGKKWASHAASFHRLHGKTDVSDEELELYSLENHVNPETASPLFVFHTSTDGTVPVSNALLLTLEYAKNKLPFELHVFPKGPHGFALANEATWCGHNTQVIHEAQTWVDLSHRWIQSL